MAENASINAPAVSEHIQDAKLHGRTPPHTCLPVWMDRLFDTVRELNPSQISREFVAANVVASGHQGKILIALRFLGLIDEKGNVTNRLRALRVVGPEFTTNLAIVVQQAYSELLSTISIKSATANRLTNFLMQKYSMSQSQAESAARFFIHLASQAGMELSEELSSPQSSKQDVSTRGEPSVRTGSPKPSVKLESVKSETKALATIEGPFGQIRVVDLSTLELARKLLDIVENQLDPRNSNQ